MTPEEIEGLEWAKGHGLLPAIIQHADTGTVLMTGYVNRQALRHARATRSRAVQPDAASLWVKGETSGNRIVVDRIVADCDRDAVLVLGRPDGPACHTGSATCFPPLPLMSRRSRSWQPWNRSSPRA